MNILVCLKQVPDTGTRIQISKEKDSIDESGIEWILNPYDEYALEEALQIKERKNAGEITVVSAGPPRVEKALRTGLAMGADKAFLLETKEKIGDPSWTAKALASVIKKENPDLIITGQVGIDENHSATGPMLAEYLNLPHAGFVRGFKELKEGVWLCARQMEAGTTEEVTIHLPALITIAKGINKPRYPSLPGIMKAKKKKLEKIDVSREFSDTPDIVFHSYSLPKEKAAETQILEGSAEEQVKKLIYFLKEKEKII